jgi:hypothetical protein
MNNGLNDIKKFIKFAAKELDLSELPKIKFVGSSENTRNAFGHFVDDAITVRITDRHPIDIARTLAHEMYHWKQKLTGTTESEQSKEDNANLFAGRVLKSFDVSHPAVFKDKAIKSNIKEDGETTSALPANHTGGNIASFDPLMTIKNILKRPAPRRTNIGKSYEDKDRDTTFEQNKKKSLGGIVQRIDPLKQIRKKLGK